jgi:glutaminase
VEYQEILDAVHASVAALVGCGRVVDYIPVLTTVDPHHFGLALATTDGAVFGVGDWQTPLSIQSLSKVYALALVLGRAGEAIWERVGREPSARPFHALRQLEDDRGMPRNPFVNAGALVVVDHLLTLTGDPTAAVLDLLRAEAGKPTIDVDEQVAKSEAEHRHRNAAVGHLLASYGTLTHPVDAVLDHYTALMRSR